MEPEDAGSTSIEVGHGEHLAADVAVANEVNEVMAPVERLNDVREREADFADALIVHGESLGRTSGDWKIKSLVWLVDWLSGLFSRRFEPWPLRGKNPHHSGLFGTTEVMP
jgi:hypothetical protein